MERWPGVVVLHDYSLLGMHRVLAQQFGERRAAQLRFAAEYPEVDASVWEEDRRLDALEFMEYPMTRRVIAGSRATIVHSEWLKEHLAELAGNGARIEDIPLGVDFGAADAPRPSADELRRRYRIPPGAFVVVSVGVVNRLKRLREVLKAFSEFRLHCPDSHFLLVGPADRIVLRDLSGMCGAMRLKHCVHFLGHRSLAELHDVIHMADVCVNLRYPTMGESSATLMSIMAMAKPVLVTPVGQFLEFPDDVCWKVRLGNHERRDIVEYFRCLRDHPDAGRKLGENARRHVLGWSWAQAAKKYEDLLCSVVDES
jgi:glycosyltransferase involved in cell wall biosynthesis